MRVSKAAARGSQREPGRQECSIPPAAAPQTPPKRTRVGAERGRGGGGKVGARRARDGAVLDEAREVAEPKHGAADVKHHHQGVRHDRVPRAQRRLVGQPAPVEAPQPQVGEVDEVARPPAGGGEVAERGEQDADHDAAAHVAVGQRRDEREPRDCDGGLERKQVADGDHRLGVGHDDARRLRAGWRGEGGWDRRREERAACAVSSGAD
jgi:hypothetical protein